MKHSAKAILYLRQAFQLGWYGTLVGCVFVAMGSFISMLCGYSSLQSPYHYMLVIGSCGAMLGAIVPMIRCIWHTYCHVFDR